MTKPSHAFFCNTACRYYPCHAGLEEINCLFCFCPLHAMKHCPGNATWIEAGGKPIKDCSACTFPHRAENYEKIIACLHSR